MAFCINRTTVEWYLYCVKIMGVITDGWMPQTYCTDMFGSACSYALSSGRIAGESAAEFLDSSSF